jgi:phosphoribosyl 1,2-cyclic phosphodiesterase
MALSFCLLGSGSKGNAAYIKTNNSAILVDCGISARQAVLRMEACGLDPYQVKAIVVTHEHRDHVAGVRVLSKRLRCPVLTSEATWQAMNDKQAVRQQTIPKGRAFEVGELNLQAFGVSHDAVDPIGLVIWSGNSRLGVATDLGQPTRLVQARLAGCQALVVEANHDLQMLATGPYAHWLKQRVRSRHGHLSNQQGAELIASVMHRNLEQVVLAHLSETNNLPDLAREAAAGTLEQAGSRSQLHVAAQDRPTPLLQI